MFWKLKAKFEARSEYLALLCITTIRHGQNSIEKIRRVDDRVIFQIAADPQLEMPKSLRVFATNKSTLLRDCELSLSALTAFAGVWLQNPLAPCNFTLTTTTSLQTPLTESNRSVCDA